MTRRPERDLAVLLDVLTEELLRSFDHEVCGRPGAPTEECQQAAEAMRRLVAAADLGVPLVSRFPPAGLSSSARRDQ